MKRTLMGATLVGLVALAGAVRIAGAASEASAVQAREILAKWMETQQIIGKEQKDWEQSREVLRSRIELLSKEVAALEEKLAQVKSAGGTIASQKASVLAETSGLKDASARLGEEVAGLETGIRALMPRLPEPLRTKLRPLEDRMPSDPGRTNISLAERFQNIVGILNEAGKANGEITLTTEVRTLKDGRPAEVKVVYVGLGQAYYLGANGEAGVGRPTATGWEWQGADDRSREIFQVIQILQNKAKPQYVPLPVSIQ
jgi:hypothetical protein